MFSAETLVDKPSALFSDRRRIALVTESILTQVNLTELLLSFSLLL